MDKYSIIYQIKRFVRKVKQHRSIVNYFYVIFIRGKDDNLGSRLKLCYNQQRFLQKIFNLFSAPKGSKL